MFLYTYIRAIIRASEIGESSLILLYKQANFAFDDLLRTMKLLVLTVVAAVFVACALAVSTQREIEMNGRICR